MNFTGPIPLSKSLKKACDDASAIFWKKNQLAMKQNPTIAQYITELEHKIGTQSWNDLPPNRKLGALHTKIVSKLRDTEPSLVETMNTKGRKLDFSLYTEIIDKIADINFTRAASTIAQALGLPINTSAADLRTYLNQPANLANIQTVTNLNLSELNLTQLPPEISHFTNLICLNIQNNRISTFPHNLPISIQDLYISHNPIKAFPPNFNQLLPNLTYLDTRHNQLENFPNSLPENLRFFYIQNNQILGLPNNLALITPNLLILNVANNRITDWTLNLPPRLQYLNIQDNGVSQDNIVQLQNRMGDLTHITS